MDAIINVDAAMNELQDLLVLVRDKYEALTSEELLQQPLPGKWSRQQVLGHLIDSAINNLKRFTDIQILEQPYTVIGYKQDGLMEVNGYQQLPLQHLLILWQSLNQQIIFVVRNTPADRLSYQVQPQYGTSGTQTLAWLICDYVSHMKHHLLSISFI